MELGEGGVEGGEVAGDEDDGCCVGEGEVAGDGAADAHGGAGYEDGAAGLAEFGAGGGDGWVGGCVEFVGEVAAGLGLVGHFEVGLVGKVMSL